MELRIENEFIQEYLEYVEDTESPRIYHIWSAIGAIGAALGRRVHFPFGIGPIYPNEYILLVGPPATRKSTAINIAGEIIKRATSVRIAPEDTAGKRQGLIAAMEDKTEEERTLEEIETADAALFLEQLSKHKVSIDTSDRHILFAIASEFSVFIGQHSIEMVNFLTKVYDGEDYKYQLKNEQRILTEPLMGLIGGTTPTSISDAFPTTTIGHGLMSRMVLVFANQKYKRIARPPRLNPKIEKSLVEQINYMYLNLRGEFAETDKAKEIGEQLYEKDVDIQDPRFVYYCDRRQTHHIKLSMCLAAARKKMCINQTDVEEADRILGYTEQFMPEALGEFGLSPLATATQKLWEFIQHNRDIPIAERLLHSVMHRDMKRVDLLNTLSTFVNQNKLKRFDGEHGTMYLYNDKDSEILNLIGGDEDERARLHEETGNVKFRFNQGD